LSESPTMRTWIFAAAINGVIAVAMRAAAAHALAAHTTPQERVLMELGADFQLWHALGLLGVGLLTPHMTAARGIALLKAVGVAFVMGIVLFSGGLYLLALGPKGVSSVVPMGGVLLILGWLGLSAAAFFIDMGPKKRR
jgi:uncharacterized membrane protein YgdD (TMEM256/DUF423 family)